MRGCWFSQRPGKQERLLWLWIAFHSSMELWGNENNTLLQVDNGKGHMILLQEQSTLDHQQKTPHYSSPYQQINFIAPLKTLSNTFLLWRITTHLSEMPLHDPCFEQHPPGGAPPCDSWEFLHIPSSDASAGHLPTPATGSVCKTNKYYSE